MFRFLNVTVLVTVIFMSSEGYSQAGSDGLIHSQECPEATDKIYFCVPMSKEEHETLKEKTQVGVKQVPNFPPEPKLLPTENAEKTRELVEDRFDRAYSKSRWEQLSCDDSSFAYLTPGGNGGMEIRVDLDAEGNYVTINTNDLMDDSAYYDYRVQEPVSNTVFCKMIY